MKIFFIGIGGISMSALAVVCKNLGYEVYGSDRDSSDMTKKLQDKGITIYQGHKRQHITKDLDIVVYTAAIPKDNEELLEAKKLNIKLQERATFLGHIMEKYENSIAIAGTHGKTTTTSMTTLMFNRCEANPTALIGGVFSKIGGNLEIGLSETFITEACEYVDSFLHFYPKIAMVTNIEADHLDYFKDLNQIKSSFLKFVNQVKEGGFAIANGDDENIRSALKDSKTKVYYYGFDEKNDFLIKNMTLDSIGYPSFELYFDGKLIDNFTLSVFGKYNVYNATCAIACGYLSNLDLNLIKSSIKEFEGVDRRFEFKGEKNSIKVYDDYAHHPTEIKATLSAASSLNKNRLITIFQPHTYTRTKALFNDFVDAFEKSDVCIFADIYPAREPFDPTISSKMLKDELQKRNKESYHFDSFDKIVDFLNSYAKEGDIVFTIGAGDVYKIGLKYLEK